MSRRVSALLALFLAVLPVMPVLADMAQEKPLLIIRFNQQRVYFDRPLAMAINSAERAKPGVVYDVVSYAADGDKEASTNLRSVIGGMYRQGVPSSRVQIENQSVASGSQEIHIYVR